MLIEREKIKILENDNQNKVIKHEEEVSLRLKLESKLNNLYSLYRDLESKYKRSLEDLCNQEVIRKQTIESNEKLTEELYRLNTENIK